ncbi:MAG: rRNA adenine N(6)-methyltransferase family protein [Streptosporangiaceae bacterium]
MSATARSRRAWGWHPLTEEWAAQIVADAAVRPGELVLDIGAGRGALTAGLVERGARVIAVELHPARVRQLRGQFAGLPVTVVHADAASMRLPRRPFRVVASPPYAISSPLLRLLLAPSSHLTAADLVLQRAVVRRYTSGRTAGPGGFRRQWRMNAGRSLPCRAFRPPPRVDSAVLVVRRR